MSNPNPPRGFKAHPTTASYRGSVGKSSTSGKRVRRALHYALRKLETHLNVYIVWIAGSELRPSDGLHKLPDGLSMTLLHEHPHVDSLLSTSEDLSQTFVKSAFERGDIAVGVQTDDGTLVAYVWRTFTQAPYTNGVWVRVRRPTVYGYKAFTHPNYRGQRLSAAITQELDRICLERAAERRVALIAPYNQASKKAEYHRGSSSVGYAALFDWGRCRFTFHTAAVKRAGFKLFWPAK